ncbi:XTP/dITP diphosphatase [Tuberibacillus calidus]|uniref:XTP/dITP diphosphatase n=1 Tax=Tuberibacillus calidus TaxID=340097 RepID=UPI00040552A0|nr:XTP/dITP diphosphatase [Tuberibacillus calidus]
MKKVLIASKNEGKIKEFRKMLAPYGTEVLSLNDLPDAPNVEETGATFQENARLKAETIAERYQCLAIADDSGLAIDALGGRPGIYSARYAGEEKDDRKNIEKVLKELEDVPMNERSARFVCVLAVSRPGSETVFAEGECRGLITTAPRGEGGFGYDPIFYIPEMNKTFAELTSDEKNAISHRARALKKLEKLLPELLG